MHTGYIISCYSDGKFSFSVPISSTREEVDVILNRGSYPINGDELTQLQFDSLKKFLMDGCEIGWVNNCEYFLEGVNIPEADRYWIGE